MLNEFTRYTKALSSALAGRVPRIMFMQLALGRVLDVHQSVDSFTVLIGRHRRLCLSGSICKNCKRHAKFVPLPGTMRQAYISMHNVLMALL
eukprot:6174902-Pleurochrysis_carterae.AAC.1